VIDADSHLLEPPDLWTSRMAARWVEHAPRVEVDPGGVARWRLNDRWLYPMTTFGVGRLAAPTTWQDIDPACYDARARLAWMDHEGIDAQILYPNLVAFETFAVMAGEPELQQAILRAYNDYLVEFASEDPRRFALISAVPFWDVDEAISEMTRCRELGHHGVLWASTMTHHELPSFTDPHWDRFYAAAQDLEMSINFHVATGLSESQMTALMGTQSNALSQARNSLVCLGNAQTIAEVLTSELCVKYPRLAFVSVESGFGYVPYVLEIMDFNWVSNHGSRQFPDRLLPSEYFRRQVYTMFFFERDTLRMLDLYPDNVMFETDFPHPGSITKTPYSEGVPAPSELIAEHVAKYDEALMDKVLYANAARVYRLN
jgi:predicted TIM-barrel fold metal-dependent hydrolase